MKLTRLLPIRFRPETLAEIERRAGKGHVGAWVRAVAEASIATPSGASLPFTLGTVNMSYVGARLAADPPGSRDQEEQT